MLTAFLFTAIPHNTPNNRLFFARIFRRHIFVVDRYPVALHALLRGFFLARLQLGANSSSTEQPDTVLCSFSDTKLRSDVCMLGLSILNVIHCSYMQVALLTSSGLLLWLKVCPNMPALQHKSYS